MQPTSYQAPQLSPTEATPQRVRDEFVSILVAAFGTVSRIPNASPNPIQLRNDVERFVRGAIRDAGADFDEPTPEALQAVIRSWREKGGTFLGDATLIQHHSNEMSKLVNLIA
jgi:hypothetical protein